MHSSEPQATKEGGSDREGTIDALAGHRSLTCCPELLHRFPNGHGYVFCANGHLIIFIHSSNPAAAAGDLAASGCIAAAAAQMALINDYRWLWLAVRRPDES
jgi:hypothetical protein